MAAASFNEPPHLKVAIVQAMWTSENAIPKQRPTPDQANLITASEINQMGTSKNKSRGRRMDKIANTNKRKRKLK